MSVLSNLHTAAFQLLPNITTKEIMTFDIPALRASHSWEGTAICFAGI